MYFLWGKLDWLEPSEWCLFPQKTLMSQNTGTGGCSRRCLHGLIGTEPMDTDAGLSLYSHTLAWPGILFGPIKPWGSLQIPCLTGV